MVLQSTAAKVEFSQKQNSALTITGSLSKPYTCKFMSDSDSLQKDLCDIKNTYCFCMFQVCMFYVCLCLLYEGQNATHTLVKEEHTNICFL